MSFGLYIPRQSPIHALSVQAKLLGLAVAGVAVVLLPSLSALAILLAIVSLLPFLAKLPLPTIFQQFRPLLPLLLAIFVIQGWIEGWETAGVAVLRFAILILLATILMLTTRISDLVEAIEQALQPCRRFGINPAQVSFMIALAIRLVPVLMQQFHDIQEAQRARGLDRNWVALLVPLLVKTLHMADDLSNALDARCYDD
ncbi:MAG: energy-coupling factor transporter transmembrane protein EcfT [Elainellaceae cyanobacterium]